MFADTNSSANPQPCQVVDLVGIKAVSGERNLTRQLALLDEELAALLAAQVCLITCTTPRNTNGFLRITSE